MYRVLLIICYVCIIYGTTNVHAAESEYNVHNSKIYFRFGESVIKSWFRENETAIADIDFVFSSINTQEFSKIRISGSASPEGSRHFNEHSCYTEHLDRLVGVVIVLIAVVVTVVIHTITIHTTIHTVVVAIHICRVVVAATDICLYGIEGRQRECIRAFTTEPRVIE